MEKKCRCKAPIDNKNLSEDAFEDDVFQDLYAASDHRKRNMRHLIGYHREWGRELGGAIIEAKWHYGEHIVCINVLAVAPQEDFDEVRKEVFACAADAFKAWQREDNPCLVVETEVRENTLVVSFYFDEQEYGLRMAEVTEPVEKSRCSAGRTGFERALAYVREQLGPETLAIIKAQVDRSYSYHMAPSNCVTEDCKVIDLLEEWGEDNDMPEGWWENEGDIDNILLKL